MEMKRGPVVLVVCLSLVLILSLSVVSASLITNIFEQIFKVNIDPTSSFTGRVAGGGYACTDYDGQGNFMESSYATYEGQPNSYDYCFGATAYDWYCPSSGGGDIPPDGGPILGFLSLTGNAIETGDSPPVTGSVDCQQVYGLPCIGGRCGCNPGEHRAAYLEPNTVYCDDGDMVCNQQGTAYTIVTQPVAVGQTCSDGTTCHTDGQCGGLTGCQDSDGDGYGNPGSSSCSLGSQTDCDDSTSGDPAGCPTNPSQCTSSTSKCAICVNPGEIETCGDGVDNDCNTATSDTCSVLCPNNVCGSGETCLNCAQDCGACKECQDTIDNDGDGKKDYSATAGVGDAGCVSTIDNDETNCGDGKCEGGETSENCATDCPASCTNDCSSGQTRCSGSYAQACGNYDVDSCLEWNTGTSCQYGCSNGICQQCTPLSQSQACGIKVCGTVVESSCGQIVTCGSSTTTCSLGFGTCSASGTKTCNLATGQWNTQCTGTTDPRTANCQGKACGSDQCGGVCGTCDSGTQTCNTQGQCENKPCTPNCTGRVCGPDPTNCGQVCGTTGTCNTGESCSTQGQCIAACKDADNDGYVVESLSSVCTKPGNFAGYGDRNDTDSSIHPGAGEICDLKDNDQDGNTDEGFVTVLTCKSSANTCQQKEGGCINGVDKDTCEDFSLITPGAGICDDDDTNQSQEGQTCGGKTISTCGTNTGTCFVGVRFCTNGVWGECKNEGKPTDEVCEDSLDNNCNGQIDEGCGTTATGTAGAASGAGTTGSGSGGTLPGSSSSTGTGSDSQDGSVSEQNEKKKDLLERILSFFLAILRVGKVVLSPITGNPVADLQKPCSDSDGGINYFVKGSGSGTSNGNEIWFQDVCYENSINNQVGSCAGENCFLSEKYCEGVDIKTEPDVVCDFGCVKGACVPESESRDECEPYFDKELFEWIDPC